MALLFRPGFVTPVSIGLWMDAVVAVLLVVVVRWHQRALSLTATGMFLASVIEGGLYSQARYAVVLLPVWIGAVALVRRHRFAWVFIGILVVGGLVTNLYFLHRFVRYEWMV
jgi:hypothetical protein